jgi:hypothetical protein
MLDLSQEPGRWLLGYQTPEKKKGLASPDC